jgi:hypothetical protein
MQISRERGPLIDRQRVVSDMATLQFTQVINALWRIFVLATPKQV